MVHLDSSCTAPSVGWASHCSLTSPPRGKLIIPHHTHSPSLAAAYFLLLPLFQWSYRMPPALPGQQDPTVSRASITREDAAVQVSPASSSPCPIPSPIARGQLLQLQRFYSHVRWPHGTSWETCGIPQAPPHQEAARHHLLHTRRQRRQAQDSLPIVIIFALRRDLSHAAATICLQDTKAMKTRLTKPVCELFSLAWTCHTS